MGKGSWRAGQGSGAARRHREARYPARLTFMVFVISAVLLPFGAAMGQVQGGKSPDEIRGSTTLAEIRPDYQVPPSHLIERLKLPPDTSRDEPLKSLKDRHGFQMDAVRGFVSEYRSGRATLPAGGRAGSAGAEREGRGRERKASLTPLILALYGSFCIVMLLLLAKSRSPGPSGCWPRSPPCWSSGSFSGRRPTRSNRSSGFSRLSAWAGTAWRDPCRLPGLRPDGVHRGKAGLRVGMSCRHAAGTSVRTALFQGNKEEENALLAEQRRAGRPFHRIFDPSLRWIPGLRTSPFTATSTPSSFSNGISA